VCSKDTYTVKVRRKTIADKMIFLIVLGIGYIINDLEDKKNSLLRIT